MCAYIGYVNHKTGAWSPKTSLEHISCWYIIKFVKDPLKLLWSIKCWWLMHMNFIKRRSFPVILCHYCCYCCCGADGNGAVDIMNSKNWMNEWMTERMQINGMKMTMKGAIVRLHVDFNCIVRIEEATHSFWFASIAQ